VTPSASPVLAGARPPGPGPLRLVRAELMKIRATRSWRLLPAGFAVFTALALTLNGFSHHYQLYPQRDLADRAQALAQAAQARTPAGAAGVAASMLTSGQVLSVLVPMLLGILLVTSEFAQHTATATFLAEPRRGRVMLAKVAAAACCAALLWLAATLACGVVTPVFLHTQHVSAPLAGWAVARPVLMGLPAFVLWAAFGAGLGAIVRGQAASVGLGLGLYAGGFAVAQLVSQLIYHYYPHGWVLALAVAAPAAATDVMLAPGRAFPHAPPAWAGLAVLAGYTVALAVAGILLTSRRDAA